MNARLAAALLIASSPALAGVRFHAGSLDAALAEARKSGKILMVDVYATWCGPCHELDRTVFASDEVAKALAPKIVALKIDGEKDAAVMDRYHVVGFPTVLFIGSDGKEIDRIFDVPEPKEFVATALGYAAGKGTLAERDREWQNGARTAELASELVFRHAVKGHEKEALGYFAELGKLADGAGHLASAELDLGKWLYLRGLKDYKRAEEQLAGVVARYPGSKEAGAADFQLAYAYHGQGDLVATRKKLEAFLASKQHSTGAVNAVAWFCFKKDAFQPWAIELGEKALAKDPKDAGLWDTLAELYAAQGRAKDALGAIDKAIANDPKEPYYKQQRDKFARLLARN